MKAWHGRPFRARRGGSLPLCPRPRDGTRLHSAAFAGASIIEPPNRTWKGSATIASPGTAPGQLCAYPGPVNIKIKLAPPRVKAASNVRVGCAP